MSGVRESVEREAAAWIDANPESAKDALFLLNSERSAQFADEIRDRNGGVPPYPRNKVVLKLWGIPVFPDENVPKDELHVRSNAGKLLAKITGLEA